MHADESHASPDKSLDSASAAGSAAAGALAPAHLDLDREKGLAITWADGRESFFPIAYLRRRSPSADAKVLREEMARNPLTVLPASRATGPLTALGAELVGNYAVRIRFSDGHSTGIFSWTYLRSIDPALETRA